MKRAWQSASETCVVSPDGVRFDGRARAPLDQDWGCDLEQFLADSRYVAHLEQHFPAGTAAEVHAAVLEELAARGPADAGAAARDERSTPSRATRPAHVDSAEARSHAHAPPAPTHGLPPGTSDASAVALATLAARLGRVIDPTVPEVIAPGSLAWKTTRGDWSDPIFRSVVLGRVALTMTLELRDGIGGPVDAFVGFGATVVELPGPSVARLSWNGGAMLEVTVHAPPAVEAEVRALVGAATVDFVATG